MLISLYSMYLEDRNPVNFGAVIELDCDVAYPCIERDYTCTKWQLPFLAHV